jgi:WD40 repeat protein
MIQWDVATGQPLRRFQGHLAPIIGLALSPDGRRAVTATGGDTMIVWDVGGEQNLIAFTCAVRYIPQLSCVERTQFGVNPPCAPGAAPPQNDICIVLGED